MKHYKFYIYGIIDNKKKGRLLGYPIIGKDKDLKKQNVQIESELNEFIDLPVQIPELVTSTNLLRLNDFLMKSDHKKTDLISVYSKYSEALLSSVFEIQNELKDILKKQSSLIPSSSKTKTKK